MVLFSFFAYALWVILVAELCRAAVFRRHGAARRERPGSILSALSVFPALAPFFLLPPGSLPPFWDIPWGGLILFPCLAVSLFATGRKGVLLPCLVIGGVLAVFFAYARQRGMPGSWANPGTFAAMPVWEIVPFTGLIGFVLLAAGFVVAARTLVPAPGQGTSFSRVLAFLAVLALFVTLFLPWSLAPLVYWPAPVAALCDFFLFWAKTLFCWWFLSCFPMPSPRLLRAVPACCALGAAMILAPSVPLW